MLTCTISQFQITNEWGVGRMKEREREPQRRLGTQELFFMGIEDKNDSNGDDP